MLTKDQYNKALILLHFLTEESITLSDFEYDFIESLEKKLEDYGEDAVLTPKQLEIIDAIFERHG